MASLLPDYTENIIVGIIYDGIYNWYITDKEIWFLDYEKRINEFKKRGFEVKEEYLDVSRRNLLILDSTNVSLFLERIKKCEISTKELRELLLKSKNSRDDTWVYDFRPSLYVDFDNCKLYSLYSEPASYEDYVPSHWKGRYFEFLELVPLSNRYWIDEDSVNLLIRGD